MDENKIRQIVKDEINRSNNTSRFSIDAVKIHHHDGIDSVKIKQSDIIPSVNTAGSITFGTQGATYTIKLNSNFTPSLITATGVVRNATTESAATRRCFTVGSAQLNPGFYLQTETNRSVIMGGPQYPFPTQQPDGTTPTVPIQGSSFISVSNAGTVGCRTSEDAIVDIFDGPNISDIQARVTIIDFSKTYIKLYVPYLTSGWRIEVYYTVT